jgi:hypothetical protein
VTNKTEICKHCGDSLTWRDDFWYSTNKNTRVCGATVVQGMHIPVEVAGHYRATVTCANCETPNTLVIRKGTSVEKWLLQLHNGLPRGCEYCGCELEDISEFDG